MKTIRSVLTFMVMSVALFLGGCASTGGNFISQPEFGKLAPDQQGKIESEVNDQLKASERYQKILFTKLSTGEKITIDDSDGAVSMRWNKIMRTLEVWSKHVTSTMGSEHLSALVFVTEADKPSLVMSINSQTNKYGPTVLLGNASAAKTWMRSLGEGVVGWGGPLLNGALQASILKDAIAAGGANNAPTNVTTTVDLGCFNCTTITP